jgi:hypothetical protein
MLINTQYTEIIAQAKIKGKSHVDFNTSNENVNLAAAEKDTFTLSTTAQEKMNGEKKNETSNTYSIPRTARELLEEQAVKELNPNKFNKTKSDVRLNEMMENISNNRIGFDREQLKKIEAMMAKIAENENLSPEQKQQAIKALEAQKQEIVEESLDVNTLTEKSFDEDRT